MICYVCIVFDDVFVLLCVLFLGCGDAVFVFDELLCVCCVLIMYLIFLCVCYVSFIIWTFFIIIFFFVVVEMLTLLPSTITIYVQ